MKPLVKFNVSVAKRVPLSRVRMWAAALSMTVLLADCLMAAGQKQTLKIHFHEAGLGVGGGSDIYRLAVGKGREQDWASESIISALQSFQFSVTQLRGVASVTLMPNVNYTTDPVPVSGEEVRMHNSMSPPELRLPDDLLYEIEHRFTFALARDLLTINFESTLKSKSRLGKDWQTCNKFSGQFFQKKLLDKIQDNLKKNAVEE